MLFIHLYETIFLLILFSQSNHVYPKYCQPYEKNGSHELRDFIFENYYKQIRFVKESSYYSVKRLEKKHLLLLATKLIEKMADPSNAKEYYDSYLKRKNTGLIKRSKIITHQLKAIENPNIVDIKLVIIEHLETSRKLSKTMGQAEKVSN